MTARPLAAHLMFMGSAEIPLSADEYRRRYVPQDIPHVWVANPGDDTLRVDVAASSGALIISVLLLPREGIRLPTLQGYRFQFAPSAFVHATPRRP